jgi:hypothetical protein
MIYINHKKKAIFIHIPKTGGTYIGPTLVKYYGFTSYLHLIAKRRPDHDAICKTHYFKMVLTGNPVYDTSFFNKLVGLLVYCKTSDYLNEAMNMTDEKWNTYTKFCFIRNPYTRALSGWKHFDTIFDLKSTFSNYLSQNKYDVPDIEYGHIFMSQKTQIQDVDGRCGVDLIGRFENLENDFVYILHQIGFDKILHTPKKVNVSNKTDSENYVFEKNSIKILNTMFADDLNLFHYIPLQV